jgi:XTP/dITP diphosphohydrolase
MKLIFATNNNNKTIEIQNILGDEFELLSLKDIGFTEDIPEPYDTLEDNALAKARHIYAINKSNCFADDTGLEIDALDGAPGVYSARYAGENKCAEDNIKKVLKNLEGKTNRKAQFRTVFALILDGEEFLFEGIVKGEISDTIKGDDGFGYDPVFIPEGFDMSFAEMSLDEKNKISHRARATHKLTHFLKNR